MPFIGNLELVAPGLRIDDLLQWLAATRDWHIGKYGCIEVKSFKRFEKFTKIANSKPSEFRIRQISWTSFISKQNWTS